jgi:hypothetical protein
MVPANKFMIVTTSNIKSNDLGKGFVLKNASHIDDLLQPLIMTNHYLKRTLFQNPLADLYTIMLLGRSAFYILLRHEQNAIILENISNLITSPSSYQCRETTVNMKA